jgi:hypothetical protein
MRFGFLADPDRTRFSYLRLRRLKRAIKDASVLDAVLAELEVPVAETASLSPRAKLAVIEQRIERLRAGTASVWSSVPAPEVLAAYLFAASKRAGGAVGELFSHARADQVKGAVVTWLQGGGLTMHDAVPQHTGFDLVGYHKGALSGMRVVGVAVKNEASAIDAALDSMQAFAKYTHAIHLACAPAVAAQYLAACAEATGRWDAEALKRKLQASGFGLLMVEGDAVAQALFPKTRPGDGRALEALVAAFGAQR